MNLSTVKCEVLGKKYVEDSRLAQIYQALLCGISIMKPKKPRIWIAEKLRIIKTMDYDDLTWDSFIDECMRPKHPFVIENVINFIFRYDDEYQPSAELLALAYSMYNMTIKRKCFNAWVIYHVMKNQRLVRSLSIEIVADSHYKNVWLKRTFVIWKDWTAQRLRKQEVASEILQHLKFKNTCQRIFCAWNKLTKEAIKTREYFERLERGELEKVEDVFSIGDGEARDDLSSLPIQFSIKIFSELSIADRARCARVCRSWKVITQHDSLWNKLNFEDIREMLNDSIASRILQRARTSLCHLNMRACTNLGYDTFVAVSECRNLQDLNLSECVNLTDELLNCIIRGCPVLTYLNLSYTSITDNALRCIARYGSNLQFISLSHCTRISDQGFECILNGKIVTKLVYVDLSGCNQLSVLAYKSIAEACPKIKTWILNGIKSLSDEQLGAITTYCKRIELFEAKGFNKVSDHGIRLILTKALKILKLESSTKFSDQSMRDLGKHCHELQHLYLSDCQKVSDQFIKSFMNLKHLRILNLADCTRITDQGVKFLVDSPCGPMLKELNLTNSLRITDSALNQIQKRCGQLTHLSVAFCDQFTEAGMEVLGSLSLLEFLDVSGTNCGDSTLAVLGMKNKLKHFIASGCSIITDLGLGKFCQYCRDIECLDLSYCHQLTDAGIKNLAFCCRFVSSLNFAGCRQLTDLSVQFLSGVCHYLQLLDVSGCIMITNKSLIYVKKGCRRLKHLKICYCKGISKKSVLKLQQHVPIIEYSCEDPPANYGY